MHGRGWRQKLEPFFLKLWSFALSLFDKVRGKSV